MRIIIYAITVISLCQIPFMGCSPGNEPATTKWNQPEWIDSLWFRNLTPERCPCFDIGKGVDTLCFDYDEDGYLDSLELFYSGLENKYQMMEYKETSSSSDSWFCMYDQHGTSVPMKYDYDTLANRYHARVCRPLLSDFEGHCIGYLLLGCSMEQAWSIYGDPLLGDRYRISTIPGVECAGHPALLVRYQRRDDNAPFPPNSTQYEYLSADSVLVSESDPWGRITRRYVARWTPSIPKEWLKPLAEIWVEEVEVRENHWEYRMLRRDSAEGRVHCRVRHEVTYLPETNRVEIREFNGRMKYSNPALNPLEEWEETKSDTSTECIYSYRYHTCYILDYDKLWFQLTDVIICPDCKRHQTVLYREQEEYYPRLFKMS